MTRLNPIRILLCDDHPMIRVALRSMISMEPNMQVVGEATNGSEALIMFQKYRPDILLMDVNMPVMDGLEAMVTILNDHPEARFILLTNYDSEEDIFRGLEAGAMGYILKDTPQSTLINAIQAVYSGKRMIPPELAQKLAQRKTYPRLSPREMDIIRLMKEGMSNQMISVQLNITESTVKSHVKNILFKLGASDRTQAVTKALQRGILRNNE
ncbi:MAG TPA: response regulator transcription factor [Anaerolineales bacterium]|nr:response regulator transcription factor [Anaerolineales bacterium]